MATPAHPPSSHRFGLFELDLSNRELRKSGVPLKLHPQPFRVLQLLVEHPGQVVTREEIRKAVWGDNTFVDFERGINFAINQIRAALCDDPEAPRYVETVPRRGYRFIFPMTAVQAEVPVLAVGTPHTIPHLHLVNDEMHTALDPATAAAEKQTAGWVRGITLRSEPFVVALVAMGAVAFFGFRLQSWFQSRSALKLQNIQITRLTENGKAFNAAISPDGRYVAYVLQEAGEFGLHLRQVATESDAQLLPREKTFFAGLTFSPDGEYIYFVQSDKTDPALHSLYKMPLLGGPARLLLKNVDSPVSFSPDGRQFTYTRAGPTHTSTEIRIANADGNDEHTVASLPQTWAGFQPGPAWSPDGGAIATSIMHLGSEKGFTLRVISLARGEGRDLYSTTRQIGRPQWLQGGNALLAAIDDDHGQLWTISYPDGKASQITNDLANYDQSISLSRDAKTIATIQWNVVSQIWEVPSFDSSEPRQLTSGTRSFTNAVAGPDGRLLAQSTDDDLWIINDDGKQPVRLVETRGVNFPAWCGVFVVFDTYQSGTGELIRVDTDGTHLTKLATGPLTMPRCSPDARFIYYVLMSRPQKILRLPMEGGSPVEIGTIPGNGLLRPMNLSPDGKLLSYFYEASGPNPGNKIDVIPVEGGPPVHTFDAPAMRGGGRWSPDGKAFQYVFTQDGVSNLWEQPLDGGKPRQLTHLHSGGILNFAWYPDGRRLLLARGEIGGDVVLLRDLH
jgi:eukaryotic-like serine/threonine-protein kinase